MRVYNPADHPVQVDGGREIAARSHGEANSRHPLVADQLADGRLLAIRTRPPAPPAAMTEEA